MRLLHTSDWHLGRSFHREDLLGAQAAFVDWLVEVVRREAVHLVLIAGDLYDRALPAVDAVRLCDEALRRLAATGARTVVISGNHDSSRRLGFAADLIAGSGVHLRTDPRRAGEPVVVGDEHGDVAVYGMPYLEPDAVRAELGCDGRGHAAVLDAALGAVRADLAGRERRTRSVVLAHAFVAGGQGSDSERDISVGEVSAVPVGSFRGFTYTALGHLHGAQQLGPGLRYSGSPLAYSFSEEHQVKSVTLVELGADGVSLVEALPCPVPRGLGRLRGPLADLLADPALAPYEQRWLAATLTDPARPRDAMRRLRARFPHTLALAFEPADAGAAAGSAASYAERLCGRADLEIAEGFVEHVRHSPATREESALLAAAFEQARQRQAEAVG